MSLDHALLIATAAVWPLLVMLEFLFPARWQPRPGGWPLIGLASFATYAALSWYLPQLLPAAVFEHSVLPGADLGIAGGALVGWLTATLVGYGWHRAAHRVPLLWRLFHQVHHAPQRLDAMGAAIFHPSEMAMYTLIGLAVSGPLLGLHPTAASIVGLVGVFNAVFQHANLATPRWLSWFVQRPEAHSIHHARDVHGWNYSDFPLWDRLFGTYREGEGFQRLVGFDDRATGRWLAMAFARDVRAPDFRQPAEALPARKTA